MPGCGSASSAGRFRRVPEGEAAYRQAMERFADLASDSRIDVLEARDGEAYAVYRLGDLLWVAGREAEAANLYSRTIDITRSTLGRRPDHTAAWMNLAGTQMNLGDLRHDPVILRDAEATWRHVLSDLIGSRADVRPMAEQFSKHRTIVDIRIPEAPEALASGVDIHRLALAGSYMGLGMNLEIQWRPSEAETCYRQALAMFPTPVGGGRRREQCLHAAILRWPGGALHGAGRYRQAVEAYREVLAVVPNDPKVYERLAGLLATCPDPDLRDPREAIRLARSGASIWYPTTGTSGSLWAWPTLAPASGQMPWSPSNGRCRCEAEARSATSSSWP